MLLAFKHLTLDFLNKKCPQSRELEPLTTFLTFIRSAQRVLKPKQTSSEYTCKNIDEITDKEQLKARSKQLLKPQIITLVPNQCLFISCFAVFGRFRTSFLNFKIIKGLLQLKIRQKLNIPNFQIAEKLTFFE